MIPPLHAYVVALWRSPSGGPASGMCYDLPQSPSEHLRAERASEHIFPAVAVRDGRYAESWGHRRHADVKHEGTPGDHTKGLYDNSPLHTHITYTQTVRQTHHARPHTTHTTHTQRTRTHFCHGEGCFRGSEVVCPGLGRKHRKGPERASEPCRRVKRFIPP